MSITRLPANVLPGIVTTATDLNLDRDALLGGINRSFIAHLASAPSSGSQILADVHDLNAVDVLTDGSDPLRQWINNAITLSGPRREADVFRACIPMLSPLPDPPGAALTQTSTPAGSTTRAQLSRTNRPPRIIILSSHDTIDACRVVRGLLADEFLIDLDQDHHTSTQDTYATSLLSQLTQHDFAVFAPGVNARVVGSTSPHEAITFAVGIAMGALGTERVFVLHNRAHPALLSQITGATTLFYATPSNQHDHAALLSAMTSTCGELRAALRRLRGRISLVSCADERDQLCALVNHPLSDVLRGIINNTRRAMLVDHAAFRNEVEFRLVKWRADTSGWSHGTFLVGENYRNFLKAVYSQARQSIFSTSVSGYRGVWTSAFGREILAVHKNNSTAKVVRVFVFDRRLDVLDEDHVIFAEQQAAGVEVLLYFDKEDDLFLFPSDLGNDWTLVDDGRVIGVTRRMGETLEAKWYFDDDDQSGQFREYMRRLVERCEPYQRQFSPNGEP